MYNIHQMVTPMCTSEANYLGQKTPITKMQIS